MPPSPSRTLALRGIIVALATLLALATAEGALRLWRARTLEKNELVPLEPGDTVILSLGESTTYGLYVDEGETYSSVLEDLLNERNDGRHYRVVNLGWPAAISADIGRCNGRALEIYEPDLVLACVGHNDFSYQMNYLARGHPVPAGLGERPLVFDEEARPERRGDLLLTGLLTRWLRAEPPPSVTERFEEKPWTDVIDRQGNIRLVFDNSAAKAPEDWQQRRSAIRDELSQNIASIVRQSRRRGVPFVLVGYLDSPANETLEAVAESEILTYVDNRVEAMADRRALVIGELPNGRADLFHPNAAGHLRIAANIFRSLARRWLPGSKGKRGIDPGAPPVDNPGEKEGMAR